MTSSLPAETPVLLDETVLARARKLSSALLSDGLKDLGVRNNGCMDAAILPVDSRVTMVGTAMTVDAVDGDNFPIHVAIYTAPPGYVLVIDGKSNEERAYLGDLIMSAAQAVGFEGIVVDGLVRDRQGCVELGFPVFSRGFIQNGPLKQAMREINTPIECAGARVQPGDLVVGDADGVTVVPRELVHEALRRAEQKAQYESRREQEIAAYREARCSNKPLPELAPDWVLKMLSTSATPTGAQGTVK